MPRLVLTVCGTLSSGWTQGFRYGAAGEFRVGRILTAPHGAERGAQLTVKKKKILYLREPEVHTILQRRLANEGYFIWPKQGVEEVIDAEPKDYLDTSSLSELTRPRRSQNGTKRTLDAEMSAQ